MFQIQRNYLGLIFSPFNSYSLPTARWKYQLDRLVFTNRKTKNVISKTDLALLYVTHVHNVPNSTFEKCLDL